MSTFVLGDNTTFVPEKLFLQRWMVNSEILNIVGTNSTWVLIYKQNHCMISELKAIPQRTEEKEFKNHKTRRRTLKYYLQSMKQLLQLWSPSNHSCLHWAYLSLGLLPVNCCQLNLGYTCGTQSCHNLPGWSIGYWNILGHLTWTL